MSPEKKTAPTRILIAPEGPEHLAATRSTNDLALGAQHDGRVIWADTQSAGRGRQGARWHSAAGAGLWFSACLAGNPQGLPFAAALALRDALAPLAPVKVKWPNDLLLNGRKIAGVLVEHRGGWNALGIGVNVNHRKEDIPAELQETATSLALETRQTYARDALLEEILDALDTRVVQLRGGGYLHLKNEWAETCDIVGKMVEREGIRGRVTDIDHDGALLVETEVCLARIDHGTITIHEEAACSS